MRNNELISNYIQGVKSTGAVNHIKYYYDTFINYDTILCKIDRKNKKAKVNTRKYSVTTSKIQNSLLYQLESAGFQIETYEETGSCYFWNLGYQGAEKVRL